MKAKAGATGGGKAAKKTYRKYGKLTVGSSAPSKRRVKPQYGKTSSSGARLAATSGSGPSYAKMGQASTRRKAQQKRDALRRGAEGPKRGKR